jgi:hypothetical protein
MKKGFWMKQTTNLVDECAEIYGASSTKALAPMIGVKYTTLNKWKNEGPGDIGVVLLKMAIENKKLKDAIRLIAQAERAKNEIIANIGL